MSTPDNSPIAADTADVANTGGVTNTVDFALETPGEQVTDALPTEPAVDAVIPLHGPRTRWAAIVWGLVFAALAGGALYVVLSPQHRLELIEWVTSLEATTLALYGALAIGVIVLLFGLVGLLRRAQRALATRRSSAR